MSTEISLAFPKVPRKMEVITGSRVAPEKGELELNCPGRLW